MYRFYINKIDNEYHYAELARIFLNNDEFEVIPVNFRSGDIPLREGSWFIDSEKDGDEGRDERERKLYSILHQITGITPPWGTLTGVHPLKLAFKMREECSGNDELKKNLMDTYLITESKCDLLIRIMNYQIDNVPGAGERYTDQSKIGVYVGIPFCPTRCEYCSFASYVGDEDKISKYFDHLLEEIRVTGRMARSAGKTVESLYIGGGTPTVLSAGRLAMLLETVKKAFWIDPFETEITVEAGRPDTITAEKLRNLKRCGVNRISINPQSLNDKTLKAIGRLHSVNDIFSAFESANQVGFEVVNSDVIAGLPGETLPDFKKTIDGVIALGANNVTVHTLSVKKGSRLKDEDPFYYRYRTKDVAEMLDYAEYKLLDAGFEPYYIYKQKRQIGGLENVGWCKPTPEGLPSHSLYNIRIIEENQTIVAMGAGSIGKRYYPDGKPGSSGERSELIRIPNVSDLKSYIERFDEMIERKKQYFE